MDDLVHESRGLQPCAIWQVERKPLVVSTTFVVSAALCALPLRLVQGIDTHLDHVSSQQCRFTSNQQLFRRVANQEVDQTVLCIIPTDRSVEHSGDAQKTLSVP